MTRNTVDLGSNPGRSDHRPNIVSWWLEYNSMLMFVNKELKKRRRQQRERQKCIGFRLVNRTTSLHVHHAFFVHFVAVVARSRRETERFKGDVTRDIATLCCTKNRRC